MKAGHCIPYPKGASLRACALCVFGLGGGGVRGENEIGGGGGRGLEGGRKGIEMHTSACVFVCVLCWEGRGRI